MVHNALSIDVEEYYHAEAIGAAFRGQGFTPESRCEASVLKVLAILDEYGHKATFFTLGSIAERIPSLVREICHRGHEVACHGYDHVSLDHLNLSEFTDDVARSSDAIARASGERPIGYRAPTFSLPPKRIPYLEALGNLGFRYDSSVFPTVMAGRGMAELPRTPWRITPGLMEAPVAVAQVGPLRIPVGGGVFFRTFPYAFTRACINSMNNASVPAVLYFHPWEFDRDQPRVRGVSPVSRVRHYIGLEYSESRFKRLLSDFTFQPIAKMLQLDR